MRLVVAVLGCTLAACGASSQAVRGPDGHTWYEIECRHRIDCLEEAARLCPSGYAIGNSSTSVRGIYSTGYAVVPVQQNEFLVRCQSAPKPYADTGF